jgi:cyclic pyranopterin phosphate synthase
MSVAVQSRTADEGIPSDTRLIDAFGRGIYYVRISVTDRCNLRCRYCMPSHSPEWMERDNLMSFDELERFVRIAAQEGVRKIRLTGGEPLVRPNLPELVGRIAAVPGITDLSLTTNATLLGKHAVELKTAGLRRLNISLDSLRPERFGYITKSDMFDQVWSGIEAALAAGFAPIKLNVVVIRGFNDDEVVDIALLTRKYPFHVRFIEYMPIGADTEDWSREKVMPCAEIRERISEVEELVPLEPRAVDAGPERTWALANSHGKIGFISPVSDEFCARCNRVRLTSDGMLRGCLMRDGEVDFRAAFRAGATDEDIRDLLYQAIARKPEKHLINSPDFQHSEFYTMNRLGG